jgi:hypothetical protein
MNRCRSSAQSAIVTQGHRYQDVMDRQSARNADSERRAIVTDGAMRRAHNIQFWGTLRSAVA